MLHSFAGGAADGAIPLSGLVQAIDGNLYGTTSAGGLQNLGTAFRITPAGSFALLHTFTGINEGAGPAAALVRSSDLILYGTTQFGPTAPGANGPGTIFTMTLSGTVSTIHTFNGLDGQNPTARLVHASDGNFYGTMGGGGTAGFGVAFRFLNSASCDDTLTLSYAAGTLDIGFTLESAATATWSTWLFATTASDKLWSIPIPPVTPAVSFSLPLSSFPHVGNVFVLTTLVPATGPVCADLKVVNTGP